MPSVTAAYGSLRQRSCNYCRASPLFCWLACRRARCLRTEILPDFRRGTAAHLTYRQPTGLSALRFGTGLPVLRQRSCNYGRTPCAVCWLACRRARCLQAAHRAACFTAVVLQLWTGFARVLLARLSARTLPTVSPLGCLFYGSVQLTGSAPMEVRAWLARENGLEPKKPRDAESGLGCGDLMMNALVSKGSRLCALRPQRIATSGLGLPSASVRALSALIAASVTSSHPLP